MGVQWGELRPSSQLCHLIGTHHWMLQRFAVLMGVALLGAWIVHALRGYGPTSWEAFAFLCPFSVMVSPLSWSHYQLLLAPLFVLLLVRFTAQGAAPLYWIGLAIAFVLASLMWRPYGTIVDIPRLGFGTGIGLPSSGATRVAALAQYVLLLTGGFWYLRKQRQPAPRPALANPRESAATASG
jgi:hypothetical protein